MRASISVLVLTGLLVLSVAGITAADEGHDTVTFDMRAVTDEDGSFYFEMDGERNPTLNVKPGDHVVINLEIVGTHNIRVGAPIDEATPVESDTTQTLEFTVPENAPAEIEYVCDPHSYAGMGGIIAVEGGRTDDGNGGDGDSVVFDLTATSEGGHHFEADGIRNPTLHVQPGDHVIVNLDIVNGAHNIRVGAPVNKATTVDMNTQVALEFTVPEDFTGDITYLCEPHATAMKGLIVVGGDEASGTVTDPNEGNGGGNGGTSRESPGVGVLAFAAAGLAAAVLARRR